MNIRALKRRRMDMAADIVRIELRVPVSEAVARYLNTPLGSAWIVKAMKARLRAQARRNRNPVE